MVVRLRKPPGPPTAAAVAERLLERMATADNAYGQHERGIATNENYSKGRSWSILAVTQWRMHEAPATHPIVIIVILWLGLRPLGQRESGGFVEA